MNELNPVVLHGLLVMHDLLKLTNLAISVVENISEFAHTKSAKCDKLRIQNTVNNVIADYSYPVNQLKLFSLRNIFGSDLLSINFFIFLPIS